MKLEVEMYVRTEEGKIFKTDGDLIYLSNDKKILYKLITRIPHDTINYKVVKASYNIIDILEVGDYVNGDKIFNIDDCKGAMRQFYYDYENPNDDVGHWEEEIKSVITHEQFEQMAYKVGE
jgi:hypothetical protein